MLLDTRFGSFSGELLRLKPKRAKMSWTNGKRIIALNGALMLSTRMMRYVSMNIHDLKKQSLGIRIQ